MDFLPLDIAPAQSIRSVDRSVYNDEEYDRGPVCADGDAADERQRPDCPRSDGADYETAELYDPASGTFSSIGWTNSHGMVAATANLLTNGRVLHSLQVAEC